MTQALAQVSKTAILTLRARADEHARPDRWFADPLAREWLAQLTWPPELDRWYTPFAQAKTALRVAQIDRSVRALLERDPGATVVELGCGFSTRSARLAGAPWIALDLPEVIAARAELGDRTPSIAGSVLDPAWLDRVTAPSVILIAEGLLYYLPRPAVDGLFAELRRRWPRAGVIFDVIGQLDLRPAVAHSTRIGAPIGWAVSPPFEAAQDGLGVEVLPGLEPDRVLAETIAGYQGRFGPLLGASLRAAAGLGFLRARRSGIMVGRLRPI